MATKKPQKKSPEKRAKKKPAARSHVILPKTKTVLKKPGIKPTVIAHKKPVKKTSSKSEKPIAVKRKPTIKTVVKKLSAPAPAPKKKNRLSRPGLKTTRKSAIRKTKLLVNTFIDSEKLPEAYKHPSITLMPRDPHWIYAYWDVPEFAMKQAKEQIGPLFKKSKFTIRVHDASEISASLKKTFLSFDIDIDPKAQGWYVNSSRDNMTYYADFGVRTPRGDFYPLARSNTVSTPRASEGEHRRVSWKKVVGNGDALALVNAPEPKPQTLENVVRQSIAQAHWKALPLTTQSTRLIEKDVRDYYAAHVEALEKISVLSMEKNRNIDYGVETRAPTSPVKNDLSLDAGEAIKNNLSAFENVLIGAQSEGRALETMHDSQKAATFGTSDLGGASDLFQKQKSFVFELGTELVVYGKTEPFAEVWMGANKVDVREDGSFSLRLALPEGSVPLDFTARSSDATSVKTIVTAVHRAPLTYL